MAVSADSLVFEARSRALRLVSEAFNTQLDGLAQAARVARRLSRLPPHAARRLNELDLAFNVIRHISRVSTEAKLGRLSAALR